MSRLTIIVISFIAIFSCRQVEEVDLEKNRLKTLINNYNSAFDQKDFPQFVQYCTDDMEFYSFDGSIISVHHLVESFTAMVKTFEEPHTEINELNIDFSGHLAWAKYKEIFKFKIQGNLQEMHNLITVIFRKDERNWKISHVHMSSLIPTTLENKS